MALYIPRSIFHLARLMYVRPETFGPTLVIMYTNVAKHVLCLYTPSYWHIDTKSHSDIKVALILQFFTLTITLFYLVFVVTLSRNNVFVSK